MKNGTLYGSRLKKAYAQLRAAVGKPKLPEPDDPLRRLAIGILGVGWSEPEAERAFDRALAAMVDWNELRVSNPIELNQATGNVVPQGVKRCQELIDALHAVYDLENRMSLDRLHSLGRRDARLYLEKLNGVNEYAVAGVLLWSLGGHAIPVNDGLLDRLREAELIHPHATRAEVQAFLERHIGANDAKEFSIVMRSFKVNAKACSTRTRAASRKRRSGNNRLESA